MNVKDEMKKVLVALQFAKSDKVRIILWNGKFIAGVCEFSIHGNSFYKSALIAGGNKLAAYVSNEVYFMLKEAGDDPNYHITIEEVQQ